MPTSQALTATLNPFPEFTPREPRRPKQVRRRTNVQQGRALEVLGHAIEYLVDSRLDDRWHSAVDASAVHLLMACSRAVFEDCEELFPWHQRVQKVLLRRLHTTR